MYKRIAFYMVMLHLFCGVGNTIIPLIAYSARCLHVLTLQGQWKNLHRVCIPARALNEVVAITNILLLLNILVC